MNNHLPFIEQKDPVNVEKLKENFRKHDFTALTASCELNPQTKEEQYFQARALDAFRPIWFALQKAMGGSTEEKNLTEYANTLLPCVYDDFIGTAKAVLTPRHREGLRKLLDFKFDKHSKYNLLAKRLKFIEAQIRERARLMLM